MTTLKAGWAPDEARAQTLPLIVVVLTFTTGVVDAVSYLGLGRVFTGLQTGNVVVLGFALAGTEGFSAAPPAVSIASFFVGAAGRQIGLHLSAATAAGSRLRSSSKRCWWPLPRRPPPGCQPM